MCACCALAGETIPVWRGETFAWRRAVTNATACVAHAPALALPEGVSARTGLLDLVKYTAHHSSPTSGVDFAADYPVWNAARAVKAGDVTWQVAEVTVSPAARPGRYELGPFAIEIADRTLPPPSAWHYYLDLWQHPWAVARFHGLKPFSPEHYAKMEPLWKLLAASGQKTLTTTLVDLPWNHQCFDGYGAMVRVSRAGGRWAYDFTLFDEYVAFGRRCGLGPDIALYTMCPWGYRVSWYENGRLRKAEAKPGTPFFREYWGAYLPALAAHLKAKGWFANARIAMDERAPDDLRHINALLAEKAPGFTVSMAGNKPPSHFAGIRLDVYSQMLYYIDEPFLAELPARRAQGKITTFYVCCGPYRPNTFMNSTPGEAFWCGFFPAPSGLDGLLRWAYNSWPASPRTDSSYNRWRAGDTFLVYPDAVPSWRFLELTDGIRQAEKWRLLADAGKLPAGADALRQAFNLQDGLRGRVDYQKLIGRTRALLSR